jgi:ABC-type transport system involved in multi-copper enzyme maturation permease subunit
MLVEQRHGELHLHRYVYLHNPPGLVHLVVGHLVLRWMWLAMPLVGLILGVTTPTQEFESGTIEYLWTRPRTRARYLWTHWSVCLAELAALAAIPLLLVVLSLGFLSGYWSEWRLWAGVPMFVVATLPILGLTILMTTLRRSASSGQIFTIGISLTYGLLLEVLNGPLHLHPSPLFTGGVMWLENYYPHNFSALNGLAMPGQNAFPWGSIGRAIVLAMMFPLLAHYLQRRAEV